MSEDELNRVLDGINMTLVAVAKTLLAHDRSLRYFQTSLEILIDRVQELERPGVVDQKREAN